MASPATAAFVGGFPGDDAKIEAVNALLASGSLAVFGGSATKLIADLEALPYSARIGVVSKLAAATGRKDALTLVRALLGGGDGDVVSDSDDDELVTVFGASTKSSTAAYDHRQLALHIASAAKLGDVILDELDGSIKTMKGFALKESCVGRVKSAAKKTRSAKKEPNARQHLVSDQQLIERIVGSDTRPSDRVELLVGCMKHRRKTVLDAVLPTMAEKPETFVKYLHGASSATVAALLPKLRAAKPQEGSTHPPGWISGLTVKWDRLWKFHATTLLGMMETELQAATFIGKTTVWTLWSQTFSALRDPPAAELFKLLMEHLPYTLSAQLPHSMNRQKFTDEGHRRSILEAKLGVKLPGDMAEWPSWIFSIDTGALATGHRSIVSIFMLREWMRKLPLSTVVEAIGAIVRSKNFGSTGQLVPVLIDCIGCFFGPRKIQQQFGALFELVKELSAEAGVGTLYSDDSCVSKASELKKFVPDKKTTPAEFKVFKYRCAKVIATTMMGTGNSERLLQILKHFKDIAAKFIPTRERFLAGSTGFDLSSSLLSELIPHSVVIKKMLAWKSSAEQQSVNALQALCKKQLLTKLAGRDTSGLDAAIKTIINDYWYWLVTCLESSNLDQVWPKVKAEIAKVREHQFTELYTFMNKLASWYRAERTRVLTEKNPGSVQVDPPLQECVPGELLTAFHDRINGFIGEARSKAAALQAASSEPATIQTPLVKAASKALLLVIDGRSGLFKWLPAASVASLAQLCTQITASVVPLTAGGLDPFITEQWATVTADEVGPRVTRVLEAACEHRELVMKLAIAVDAKKLGANDQVQGMLSPTFKVNNIDTAALGRAFSFGGDQNTTVNELVSLRAEISSYLRVAQATNKMILDELFQLTDPAGSNSLPTVLPLFQAVIVQTWLTHVATNLYPVIEGYTPSGAADNTIAILGTSVPVPAAGHEQFWSVLSQLPNKVRMREHKYLTALLTGISQKVTQILKSADSNTSRRLKPIVEDLVSRYLRRTNCTDTKVLLVRFLRDDPNTSASMQDQLLSRANIGDRGVRQSLQKACQTRDSDERVAAFSNLVRTSVENAWSDKPADSDTPRMKLEWMLADRRYAFSRSLEFVTKRITNEQLEYRTAILSMFSANADIVAKSLVCTGTSTQGTSDLLADIAKMQDLWLALLNDTLNALALSNPCSYVTDCLKHFTRISTSFVTTALTVGKEDEIDIAVRAAVLDLGAEMSWRQMKHTKAKKALQESFTVPVVVSTVVGCEAIPGIQAAQLLLNTYTSRLDDGRLAHLSSSAACTRLNALLSICGGGYTELPPLRAIVEKALSNTSDPARTHWLANVLVRLHGITTEPLCGETKMRDDARPEAWLQDKVLLDYYQREFKRDGVAGPNGSDLQAKLLSSLTSRSDIAYFKRGSVNSAAADAPSEPARVRMQRLSKAAAAMYKLSPETAICLRPVREHLLRWRQDLITPSHLVADKPPVGLFSAYVPPVASEGAVDGESPGEWQEEEEDPDPWRWPATDNLAINRMTSQALLPLQDELLADATDPERAVLPRTKAASRAMSLPGGGGMAAIKKLLDSSVDGEGNTELPKPVVKAFLDGLMKSDQPMKAMQYLLLPETIDRNKQLGLNPMAVIKHATTLLRPGATTKLLRALLKDPRRAKAMGVAGMKDAMRLLFNLMTAEAHSLLVECISWESTSHVDVRTVIVQSILGMLDEKTCPDMLVEPSTIWSTVTGLVSDAECPTEIKAVLLACVPGIKCHSAADRKGHYFYHGYQNEDSYHNLAADFSQIPQIQITSPANAVGLANMVVKLCDSVAPAVQIKKKRGKESGGQADEGKAKANAAAERREAQRVQTLNDDLRSVAYGVLRSYVGIVGQQGAGGLDARITAKLVQALNSSEPFFLACDNNNSHRADLMHRIICESLVYVDACKSISTELMSTAQSAAAVPAGELPGFIDSCLNLLLHREVFDPDHDRRRVASVRLMHAKKSLESGNFLRFGFVKEHSDRERNMCKHLVAIMLTERCEKEIMWLKNEAEAMAQVLSLPDKNGGRGRGLGGGGRGRGGGSWASLQSGRGGS